MSHRSERDYYSRHGGEDADPRASGFINTILLLLFLLVLYGVLKLLGAL